MHHYFSPPILEKQRLTAAHKQDRLYVILPPQNVSLSEAVLMRKGGKDGEVKAGTLHA
jgi:hypothetical protein